MPNFTKEYLNSILATDKQQNIKDDKTQGLYITVSPKGNKAFLPDKESQGVKPKE